jgi:hypothetical protein
LPWVGRSWFACSPWVGRSWFACSPWVGRSWFNSVFNILSEWDSDRCLTSSRQFFSLNMMRTSYIWWDGWDDVSFVLDQHAKLVLYCASSLKQQSAGKHITCKHPNTKPTSLWTCSHHI